MWYRFTVRFSSLRMRFACLWDECQHLAESLHLGSQASSTLAAVLQPCLHNLHTCSKCFVNPISCAVLQTLSATPLHSWFWLSEWVCCVFINNMLFFFSPPLGNRCSFCMLTHTILGFCFKGAESQLPTPALRDAAPGAIGLAGCCLISNKCQRWYTFKNNCVHEVRNISRL